VKSLGHSYTADRLRALAIIMVIFCHMRYLGNTPEIYSFFTYHMTISIDIFFVLSGYLLTTRYLNRNIRIAAYFRNRWLRIFPLYFLFVTVHSIHNFNWFHLLSQIFFVQNYFYPKDWFISWSICVEEWFYLFLPLILMAHRVWGKRHTLALIALAIIAVNIFKVVEVLEQETLSMDWLQTTYYVQTHLRVDSILWGVAAALINLSTNFYKRIQQWMLYVPLVFLPLVGSLFWGLDRLNTFSLLIHTPIACIFTALILKIHWTAPINRLDRLSKFLSRISYGAYLIHLPIILFLAPYSINFALKLFLTLIMTGVFSWLSRDYFEEFFLKHKKSY